MQELTRNGWQVIRRQHMRETARGVVIEAQRGAQQALLTLQPDRAQPSMTAIVIVWKKVVNMRSCPGTTARQRGWGTSEYLAVLLGLMTVWRGAQAVLALDAASSR